MRQITILDRILLLATGLLIFLLPIILTFSPN